MQSGCNHLMITLSVAYLKFAFKQPANMSGICLGLTLPGTNMAPENNAFQKKCSLKTIILSVSGSLQDKPRATTYSSFSFLRAGDLWACFGTNELSSFDRVTIFSSIENTVLGTFWHYRSACPSPLDSPPKAFKQQKLDILSKYTAEVIPHHNSREFHVDPTNNGPTAPCLEASVHGVGRLSFPFWGPAYFRGLLAASCREGLFNMGI